MAHFAEIGTDNIVTNIIVVNNEDVLDENNVEQESIGIAFIHNLYNDDTTVWVQTSYNSNFRKNYAGVGHTYDETRDAFYAPQPYPSWTLNEDTCQWECPEPYPNDGIYNWNEDTLSWVEIPKPYPSWILNETTYYWEAPTPYPDDGEIYIWNEETLSWDEE